jgi:hypothetical protein
MIHFKFNFGLIKLLFHPCNVNNAGWQQKRLSQQFKVNGGIVLRSLIVDFILNLPNFLSPKNVNNFVIFDRILKIYRRIDAKFHFLPNRLRILCLTFISILFKPQKLHDFRHLEFLSQFAPSWSGLWPLFWTFFKRG